MRICFCVRFVGFRLLCVLVGVCFLRSCCCFIRRGAFCLSVCLVARIGGGANIQDHETDIRRGTVIVLLGLSVVAGQDRTGQAKGLDCPWSGT